MYTKTIFQSGCPHNTLPPRVLLLWLALPPWKVSKGVGVSPLVNEPMRFVLLLHPLGTTPSRTQKKKTWPTVSDFARVSGRNTELPTKFWTIVEEIRPKPKLWPHCFLPNQFCERNRGTREERRRTSRVPDNVIVFSVKVHEQEANRGGI